MFVKFPGDRSGGRSFRADTKRVYIWVGPSHPLSDMRNMGGGWRGGGGILQCLIIFKCGSCKTSRSWLTSCRWLSDNYLMCCSGYQMVLLCDAVAVTCEAISHERYMERVCELAVIIICFPSLKPDLMRYIWSEYVKCIEPV